MTKKDLVKVIQEVVRREVKKEVKKIFIKEQRTSKDSTPVLTDIIEQKFLEPKEEVQYTKNKSLNDVLNETVGLSKKQKSNFDEYPTMSGVFDWEYLDAPPDEKDPSKWASLMKGCSTI